MHSLRGPTRYRGVVLTSSPRGLTSSPHPIVMQEERAGKEPALFCCELE